MSAKTSRAGEQAELSAGAGRFKRTYKACENCRITKSKCERVDGTLCLKCQREQRECVFPPRRSTKRQKLGDVGVCRCPWIVCVPRSMLIKPVQTGTKTGNESHLSAPTTTRGLDPAQASNNAQDRDETWLANSDSANTGHNSHRDTSPRRQPNETRGLFSSNNQWNSRPQDEGLQPSPNQAPESCRADILQEQVINAVITNPRDAVGLLFRTADGSDSTDIPVMTADHPSRTGQPRKGPSQVYTPSDIAREVPPQILDLWSHHRFVRQGWFTEREAVGYILESVSHSCPYWSQTNKHQLLHQLCTSFSCPRAIR